MKHLCLLWICSLSIMGYAADKLTISPDTVTMVPKNFPNCLECNRTVTFKIKHDNKDLESVDPQCSFKPDKIGTWMISEHFNDDTLTLSAPDDLEDGVQKVEVEMTCSKGDVSGNATVTVVNEKNNAWESRAVLGYHQTGASSSDFTQNFFLDFFIMRGLGKGEQVFENRLNLWGNVRVASAPQQTTTGEAKVSEFNLATSAGNLKLNELAQSAEFQVGVEISPLIIKPLVFGQGNRKRMLGIIIFGGANGAFTQPSLGNIKVFDVPGPNDQQFSLFQQRYPNAASAQFVSFVPPDRQRFYRFYGAGIRMTTFEVDKPYAPPATWSFTLGQDETLAGGKMRGVTARIDVFYPLPIGRADGRFKFLFLFGTANLLLSKDYNDTPLFLKEATENGTSISPSDGRVAIVTSPTSRDTYRIGVGIDFVNVLRSWKR